YAGRPPAPTSLADTPASTPRSPLAAVPAPLQALGLRRKAGPILLLFPPQHWRPRRRHFVQPADFRRMRRAGHGGGLGLRLFGDRLHGGDELVQLRQVGAFGG